MEQRNGSPKRIFYVSPGDPWSPWTNSGFVRRLCLELRRRNLLEGAAWPGTTGDGELRGPGPFYALRRRLHARLNGMKRIGWNSERGGQIGRLLRRLPPQTAVIYHYFLPELDLSLPLRRFLFLDITVRDAVRMASYGHAGLSEAEISRREELHRQVLQHVEGVLTFSTYAADTISRDYGFPRDRIVAIGAGPVRPVRSAVKLDLERYARGEILFTGRNWVRKGGPILLDAFQKVKREVKHATLTIVGAQIDHPNVDGVRCAGLVSDRKLRSLFARASVFCMPAVCETWGLVYGEAAYAGLPIVGFDRWAMPDIVEDGVSGRLAKVETVDGLSKALIEVLSDPARMLEMGIQARRRAEEVLDWRHVVNRLVSHVVPGQACDGQSPPLRATALCTT